MAAAPTTKGCDAERSAGALRTGAHRGRRPVRASGQARCRSRKLRSASPDRFSPDVPAGNNACLGTIRKSDVVDSRWVTTNSNRRMCRLEIGAVCSNSEGHRTQAGHACATNPSNDLNWLPSQIGCFGSIRKSEVVDLARVAVISNRTRCRLEIGVCRLELATTAER